MKEVFLVSNENKNKVEDILKKDDNISRGSIIIRSASALDIKEDGYFILLDAPEDVIKKAEELVKNIANKYNKKEIIIKKIEEQENSAIEGFGNILG
ncbi:MAG: hypothetical protein QXD48_01270 [Candidatus Aenigmatarchaeota archaeon]